MSALGTSNTRLSSDDRYELAAMAQNQQRLNYPTHLIVMGGMLVFVALIIVVVAWQSRSSASKQLERRGYELEQVKSLITEINALQLSLATKSSLDEFEPILDIYSKLEDFATQAKLETKLGPPSNPQSLPQGNARKKTYPYTVRDSSLEHMLDWINISTQQIPGLEVQDITIKPTAQAWTMVVTLSRYERNQ